MTSETNAKPRDDVKRERRDGEFIQVEGPGTEAMFGLPTELAGVGAWVIQYGHLNRSHIV